MLLPALSKVKETAKGVFCLGNLKTMSQLYSMYVNENNDMMMPSNWYNNEGSSNGHLNKLGMKSMWYGTWFSKRTGGKTPYMKCPSGYSENGKSQHYTNVRQNMPDLQGNTTYMHSDTGPTPEFYTEFAKLCKGMKPISKIKRPGRRLCIYDSGNAFYIPGGGGGQTYVSGTQPQHYVDWQTGDMKNGRHNGMVNGFFMDAHAEKMPGREIKKYWARNKNYCTGIFSLNN